MFFLVFPYGNDKPRARFPAVTCILIAANVLIFLWMKAFGFESALEALALFPSHPSVSATLTSMFAHADWFHLGWNMLYLWLFGQNVEDALGYLEYAIFYFGSGFAASLLHVLVASGLTPDETSVGLVGASGAISGVMGLFAIRFYRTRIEFAYIGVLLVLVRWGTFGVPAWLGIMFWLGRDLLGGIRSIVSADGGNIAHWAHIGGMLFGMLLALALRLGIEGSKEYLMTDARTSLSRGLTWGAMENLLQLANKEPENPEVHLELARTYLAQLRHDEAIGHYRTGIELYLMRGERGRAVEVFAEMKERYPQARLSLKCEYQLANHLLEAGNRLAGLILLEGIADTYRGTPEAETALMRAGRIYLRHLGQPQTAAYCFERFLTDYPDSQYRSAVEKLLGEARSEMRGKGQ